MRTTAQPTDFSSIPPIAFREPGRRPTTDGHVSARPHAAGGEGAAFPETLRLLNDVDLMSLPDPEWIVDGMIPRRAFCIVYGPPGSCKTVLMANLAVAIATGRNFFGHQVKRRGASIYVACEDVSGWKVRLRSAKRAIDSPVKASLDVYTFPEPIDLLDRVSVDRFIRFVQSEGATAAAHGHDWLRTLECVTIDTYAGATVGGDENGSEDTSAAVEHARLIMSALDCSVVLVHHPNASGTRERGHSGLRAAADAMIVLKLEDDIIRVESAKIKNGAPFEALNLRLDAATHGGPVLRFGADMPTDTNLTDSQRKALRVLCETFTADGATKTEWEKGCTDMAAATFYRATRVLLEDRQFIRKDGAQFRPTPAGRAAIGL